MDIRVLGTSDNNFEGRSKTSIAIKCPSYDRWLIVDPTEDLYKQISDVGISVNYFYVTSLIQTRKILKSKRWLKRIFAGHSVIDKLGDHVLPEMRSRLDPLRSFHFHGLTIRSLPLCEPNEKGMYTENAPMGLKVNMSGRDATVSMVYLKGIESISPRVMKFFYNTGVFFVDASAKMPLTEQIELCRQFKPGKIYITNIRESIDENIMLDDTIEVLNDGRELTMKAQSVLKRFSNYKEYDPSKVSEEILYSDFDFAKALMRAEQLTKVSEQDAYGKILLVKILMDFDRRGIDIRKSGDLGIDDDILLNVVEDGIEDEVEKRFEGLYPGLRVLNPAYQMERLMQGQSAGWIIKEEQLKNIEKEVALMENKSNLVHGVVRLKKAKQFSDYAKLGDLANGIDPETRDKYKTVAPLYYHPFELIAKFKTPIPPVSFGTGQIWVADVRLKKGISGDIQKDADSGMVLEEKVPANGVEWIRCAINHAYKGISGDEWIQMTALQRVNAVATGFVEYNSRYELVPEWYLDAYGWLKNAGYVEAILSLERLVE